MFSNPTIFKQLTTCGSDRGQLPISHHYDIGNDLYEIMLGPTMQYTCAYFYQDGVNLDQAQIAKMDLVAKKLDLRPGMNVVDLGCGFGSMPYYLATKYKVNVLGVTLSNEQVKFAKQHYKHSRVEIHYQDYRKVTGKFDRVYSVGMFEHIGRKNYDQYYNKCYQLLKDDGIMLIHCIGTNTRNWTHNCFINKYIFPEGELPHLENLTHTFIDQWHLEDWQNIGMSYAKTLLSWRDNLGNWEQLPKYNKQFRRMWDFYRLGCAASFQKRQIYLCQMVYTKTNSNRPNDCLHIRQC